MTFDGFGLSEATLSAASAMGYREPTPVQEQVIPLALQGCDIVASAQTGTGKTAAFAIPLAERIKRVKHSKTVPALILSPTRELAQQTAKAVVGLTAKTGRRILTATGGTPYGPQVKQLRAGVDILVATPGRLSDLMERGLVDLSRVEVLVLDEADRMLDMGFLPAMKAIIAKTPEKRQTMLFSATVDEKGLKGLTGVLRNPSFVKISHKGETAATVDQFIVNAPQKKKQELLNLLLDKRGSSHVIVFARTKKRVDICAESLCRAGYAAEAIHSDLSQRERQRALRNFSKGETSILVATDVLARGIDIDGVEHVINFDLPDSPDDYVHRIGRTGRAGSLGDAVSFVSADSRYQLRDIERLVGKKIPFLGIEGVALPEADRGASPRKASRGGYRKNENHRKASGKTNGRPQSRQSSKRPAAAGSRRG